MIVVILLAYFVTIVWVAVDSAQRDFSQSKYWRSTIGWIISCIVLWIVYFPICLFARQKAPKRSRLSVQLPRQAIRPILLTAYKSSLSYIIQAL